LVASSYVFYLAKSIRNGSIARENGPHAEAIRSVRKGDWFREELYARFKVYNQIGNWAVKSNDNAIINYNEVT
jgi:hypothetical protein